MTQVSALPLGTVQLMVSVVLVPGALMLLIVG
jgi:hypothetical protein